MKGQCELDGTAYMKINCKGVYFAFYTPFCFSVISQADQTLKETYLDPFYKM